MPLRTPGLSLVALGRPRERPAEVLGLAGMCVVGAAGLSLVTLRPLSVDSPRQLNIVLATVAVALAALLLVLPHVPRPVLHAGVLLWVASVTALVASAAVPQGGATAALAYTWTSVYTAHFFAPWAARCYAALTSVALAAALLVNPYPGAFLLWCMATLTAVGGAEVMLRLVGRLRRAAVTDELTGAYNRAGMAQLADRAVAASRRSGEPVCVAVVDLDDFKQVNDRHGHAAGDRLLVELVRAWSAALRPGDLLFRSGGDEFVLLLPSATTAQADAVLGRLAEQAPSRWSYGIAELAPDEPLGAALGRADRRLYAVKEHRRRERAARGHRDAPGPWGILAP